MTVLSDKMVVDAGSLESVQQKEIIRRNMADWRQQNRRRHVLREKRTHVSGFNSVAQAFIHERGERV